MRPRTLLRPLLALALLIGACSRGGLSPDSLGTSTTTATTTTAPADPDDLAAAVATAEGFYLAIGSGDLSSAAALSNASAEDLSSAVAAWGDDLALESAAFEIGAVDIEGDASTVEVTVFLRSASFGDWEYTTTVGLTRTVEWQIDWSPRALHPDFEAGDRLVVVADWPRRGAILAGDGVPLAYQGPVHVIGVVPQWIEDLDQVTQLLEVLAGIPPSTVVAEIERPGVQPDWFLPVGTIDAGRAGDAATLAATPGIILQDGVARILPSGDLADHIVGEVAPITLDQLTAWGRPYKVGDLVGRSGIELALEPVLAGSPDLRVVRINQFGREVSDLLMVTGRASADVKTTLDLRAQRLTEQAIDRIDLPSAIVLIDVATGGVVASASSPDDGIDRALFGLYPPGSSFKVVTAAALLATGLTPSSPVECPAEVFVGGLRIGNAGGRHLGSIDLQTALAESCNTTFAAMAADLLAGGALAATARGSFGFDTGYEVGLPAATSRFPDPTDSAELGAQAMGQGRVLVTPIHQASVAAAVAGSGWLAPTLLADLEGRVRIPLDATVQASLASMMRLAVSDGTAQQADVPGRQVAGKTGSAEFDDTGSTHAWFIGFWDGYAIAVVVEGGGSGGQVAAPIAAELIELLGD